MSSENLPPAPTEGLPVEEAPAASQNDLFEAGPGEDRPQSDMAAGEEETFFAPSPETEIPDQPPSAQVRAVRAEPSPTAEPKPLAPVPRSLTPAAPEAVKQAIDEVMAILASLREAVDKMDEVLEILEEAERQKTADEREIEALRQQLRRFHRPAEEIARPVRPAPTPASHQSRGDSQRPARDPREARSPYRAERNDRDRNRNRNRDRDRERERHDAKGHASRGPHPESGQAAATPPESAADPVPPTAEDLRSSHGADTVDPS